LKKKTHCPSTGVVRTEHPSLQRKSQEERILPRFIFPFKDLKYLQNLQGI